MLVSGGIRTHSFAFARLIVPRIIRMRPISRIGVGSVQHDADCEPILWGLMSALRQRGQTLQAFRSRACFAAREGARVITGKPPRHLDSWLTDSVGCSAAFQRAMSQANLAVVMGTFDM